MAMLPLLVVLALILLFAGAATQSLPLLALGLALLSFLISAAAMSL